MSKGICIIVVDDDPLMHSAYDRYFRRQNQLPEDVHVIMASGGQEAIRLVGKHDARMREHVEYLLITDCEMKGMQGPKLLEELDRILERRLLVRVLASGNPDFRDEAIRLRSLFLPKPFRPDDLKTLINAFLLFFR